jgi:hypothetical protein
VCGDAPLFLDACGKGVVRVQPGEPDFLLGCRFRPNAKTWTCSGSQIEKENTTSFSGAGRSLSVVYLPVEAVP